MTDPLLLERYKIAFAEYRAEVALGTERQKLFIGLNPLIAAFSASTTNRTIATAALALAVAASLSGIFIVHRSHGRFRQSRGVLLRLAKEVGAADDWQTTGGMRAERGEPRLECLKVVTVVKSLLGLYVFFDLLAIAALWR